jgi:hypothetical protein
MLVFCREIDSIALCVFGPDIAELHNIDVDFSESEKVCLHLALVFKYIP